MKKKNIDINQSKILDLLMDNMPDSIYFKDKNSKFVKVSKSVAKVLKIKDPKETVGKTDFDFFSKEHAEKALQDEKDIIKKGKPIINFEEKETFENSEDRWVSTIKMPLYNEEEKIIGTFGISRDITDRKKAEEKLQRLNSTLRTIRNINQLITKEKDKTKLIKGACKNFTKERSYYNAWIALTDAQGKLKETAESGIGKDFQALTERINKGKFTSCWKKAMSSSDIIINKDPKKDCSDCPLADNSSGRGSITVRLEHDKKVYGILSASIPSEYIESKEEKGLFNKAAGDISFALYSLEQEEERKKIQELLSESKKQLELALSGGSLGTWDWNIKTNEVQFNKRWAKLLGYSLDEIKPHFSSWEKLVNPEDMPGVQKKLNAYFEGRAPAYEVEFRMRSKSGKWIWILNKGKIFERDADGNPIRACGTHLDITKRKEAEREISNLAKFPSENPYPVIRINKEGKVIYSNKVGKIQLKKLGSKVGFKAPKIFYDITTRLFRKKSKKSEVLNFQIGDKIYEFIINPIKGTNYTNLYGRDITERIKAEEDLLNSEKKFRILFKYAPDAYYINDLKGTFIDGNKAAEKLLGYKKKDLIGKSFLKLKLLSPKHIVRASKLLVKNALRRPTGPDEFILNRKDGSKVIVEISTYPVKFDNKLLILGIVRDITEKKKAEDKLRYLSFHDSLTSIYNRNFFSEELERLQKSRDFPISIILLDVDGLKVINDYLGHSKGDELLMILTGLVQKAIRESDIFARVGGDEFEILLPKTDYDKGREIIDRINEEVENHNDKNKSFPLILSTGLATSLNKVDKLIETSRRADNAMYNEKNSKKQKSREIIENYLNKINK